MSESTNELGHTLYIGRATSMLIILSLIAQDKEHSGYSLIKKIKELSKEKLSFRVGTIYSHIERLCEQGLLTQHIRDISSRERVIRQKSVYSLTSKGMEVLEQMRQRWEDTQGIIREIIREEEKRCHR
ncbi:MAG: PadR family transcriptional regulator [Candidatus Hodarchaeales archaeon]